MLGWMVYASVVALIFSGAALAGERAAQLRKAPTRWLWAAAILGSVILPAAMPSFATLTPAASRAGAPMSDTLIPLGSRAPRILQPSAWVTPPGAGASRVEIIPNGKAMSLDAILLAAWGATSGAIVLIISLGGVQLHRRKGAWTLQLLAGAPTYVSQDVGPAVVGLIHPSIVVPHWIADATQETQALVIAHERSHLDAGDARLLALAVLLLAVMPWNLPLWWQVRRLRFAIEVDCDARVLKAGHDVARYGEALILVGERQSRRVAVAAAMTESKSFLEQRIRKMLWKPTKLAWPLGIALAGVCLVMAAAAAEVTPPAAGLLQARLEAAPPSQAGDVQMKRYKDAEWGFAVDVPSRWNAFPPVTSQNPNELVRFLSNEHGTHGMLVIRDPYVPGPGAEHLLQRVRQGLAEEGFAHFSTGQTRIGSSPALYLDFDKTRPDGKLWSVREYYIPDGTLVYVLGFGTTDKAAMFGLYDRMAKSFTFDRSAGE